MEIDRMKLYCCTVAAVLVIVTVLVMTAIGTKPSLTKEEEQAVAPTMDMRDDLRSLLLDEEVAPDPMDYKPSAKPVKDSDANELGEFLSIQDMIDYPEVTYS